MKRLGLACALFVLACGLLAESTATQAATRLRAANIHGSAQPYTQALKRWAEEVDKATNGEVKIAVFDSGSVVSNQQDSYSQVKLGTVDATISILVKDDVPALQIVAFPYAFRGYEDWRAFMDSPDMAKLMEEFRTKTGIRILGAQYLGSRHFTANKPIKRPEDLQGLKMRAVEIPIFLETIRGLGALATPVALQEVLGGLKTGVIDGQENPIPTIHALKFYEAQKVLSLTGHLNGGDFWMMNDRKFQSLPPAQQEIVLKAAKEAMLWGDQLLLKQEKELLADLKAKGMTVIGPEEGLDVPAFVQKVRANVWPKLSAEVGQSVLDTLLAKEKK
jgi:tripartite ATP-independent transporter DctP family solute receptor